ncbi:MAG: hypothetical protein IKN91_00185 [Paludibacteraceae bacterium]|nr:hypothetical protein [Paludibacteraceae bacterium]
MTKEELQLIKAKKTEAWIGLIFIILPLFAIFSLFIRWFGIAELLDWTWLDKFTGLAYVTSADYAYVWYGGDNMKPTTLFLGLSAIAGVYLLKGNTQYLFAKTKENKKEEVVVKE